MSAKSMGQKMIDMLIDSKLFHASCASSQEHECLIVWSSQAPEQIEAFIMEKNKVAMEIIQSQTNQINDLLSKIEALEKENG